MIKDLDKVTAEHIKEASVSIKNNRDEFSKSTRYDVLIDGELFPPKEVFRLAYKLAIGRNIEESNFYGGESTNKFFLKLGFEIINKIDSIVNTTQIWKLGCKWDTGTPSFYELLKKNEWVVGVDNTPYKVGDLIAIADGYDVIAIAKINETPLSIIEFENFENEFEKVSIPFKEGVNIAISDWYELDIEDRFKYQLQAGIRKIQQTEIKNRIIQLWQNQFKAKQNKMNTSINTILYGPPGTGKTYNTINKALEIVGYDIANKERSELKIAFENYVKSGQIKFTTFHQSMSYEDFIEGIKPETKNDNVIYNIKDGLFKMISNKAFASLLRNNINDEENYISPTFDQLHTNFLKSIEKFAGTEEFIFKTIYDHDIKLIEINGSTIIVMFRWKDVKNSIPASQRFAVTKEKLKILFEAGINPHEVKSLKQTFTPYMQHNLSVFYAVYKKFYQFIESNTEIKTIEEVEIDDYLAFEEINEEWNLKTTEEKKSLKEESKKYVLIIDEINRGNVSQIFGELITLIEEDKRIGCNEELKLSLPYSKKDFGVPPNLFILGTMNTADRSVEALDSALRRRFVFEEMMPIPELLSPQRMLWKLWWEYQDTPFTDEPFLSIAKGMDELLGASHTLESDEDLWDKMKTEGKSENQIKYFDSFQFDGINLKHLLQTINKRIEVLLNRDNLIGHSYFLNVVSIDQLKRAFQNQIIPLLQEYFFGDYGKIGLVLGVEFVLRKVNVDDKTFAKFEYDGAESYLDKNVFVLTNIANMSNDVFLQAVINITNGN